MFPSSFFLFNPHLRIYLLIWEREKGRKGGRERLREREQLQSVASCMCPDGWLNLQPRNMPWLGFEPTTFWCIGQHSNQLSHLARVPSTFLMWLLENCLCGLNFIFTGHLCFGNRTYLEGLPRSEVVSKVLTWITIATSLAGVFAAIYLLTVPTRSF